MEAGLTFPEIARLISSTNKTEIQPTPLHASAGAFLYSGVDKNRRSHDPFQVLYLAPNCTKNGIDDARRAAQRTQKPTEVVYAPSLPKLNRQAYQELLQENWIVKSYNTREYLLSFIKSELENYQERLSEIEPTHYIQPRVKTPSGVRRKLPDPLESILVRDDGDKSPGIGILLAEPGQGKTYTTQHLATRLLSRKIIPIYISSSQWSTIHVDDMKSINRILTHCFRYFDSPIGWMDGNEAEFIRVTLKAGIFAIIFDGFDEYALWNKGEVRALDVLTALHGLAISTGGRILLTSRTSFWESNFSDPDSIATKVFKLLPFDQQHAKNYFNGRLPRQSARGRAVDIFNNLAKLDQEFSGRGFMLSLIADLATDSGTGGPSTQIDTPATTLNWILTSLCEREIKRRSLQMSATQQIEAFQLLAFDTIRGHELRVHAEITSVKWL